MRRVGTAIVVLTALALVVAGAATSSRATPATRSASPTKISIWVGWSARELAVFKSVVDEWDKKNPNVTVDLVGSTNDDKLVAAIRGGNAPDVASSFNSYNVGTFCSSGAFIDLGPYLKQDHLSVSDVPRSTAVLHQVQGDPVRAAGARRRLRPLLQQDAVQAGRDHAPSTHHLGADRRCEEADRRATRRARSRSPASTRSSASTRTRPSAGSPRSVASGPTRAASRTSRATRPGRSGSAGRRA